MNIVAKHSSFTILTQSLSKCAAKQYIYNGSKCCVKNFSFSTKRFNQGISDVKEIEIPMPYGKLAAKAWGSEKGIPVLALHGWLDNCGTFDRLMPLLSDKLYIIAIDAPGHGMSSHKPPGCLYTDMDAILDYRKALEYLGWSKFYLIGHSFGGASTLLFSSLFPDLVEKAVAIDIAKPFSAPISAFPDVINKASNEILKIEKKLSKPSPVYALDAAAVRLRKGMHDEITPEGAEILLKRGSRPSACGKGVIFSRDLRCQQIEYISLRSHELVFQYMSKIQSELMLIMATNSSPYYQPDKPDMKEKSYETYRKFVKKFVLEHVEGNHFVHLNNPERVAPLINKFLVGQP